MTPGWIVCLCWLAIGPVVLRGGERIEPGRVEAFTPQGVRVLPDFSQGQPTHAGLIPWAEVTDIEGGWGDAEPYRQTADALRRAEARLARGDATGARRLLEPLGEQYLAETGPTTAAVCSALAITRLLRDDRPGAARAWLGWRAEPQGPARPWIDAESGLCPGLPPVWAADDARAFLRAAALPPGASEHAVALADLYQLAAASAVGPAGSEPLTAPPARLRADPGVRLVWDAVRAQAEPQPEARQSGRDALARRLDAPASSWEHAWCRLATGASLLGEPDPIQSDAGAAELITVVLLHQDAGPGLAALAADLASEYFERTGRPDHAAAVRSMHRAARSGLGPTPVPRPATPTHDPIHPTEDRP